jgi:S-adenosylmethionine uptake transporter
MFMFIRDASQAVDPGHEALAPFARFAASVAAWQARRHPALPKAALAAGLMLFASALFALQGALVKAGLEHIAPLDLVFFRGLVCAVIVLGLARASGKSLATARPVGQFALGVIGFVSLALFFVAIGMLPLVTATALNYTAPLFLALLLGLPGSGKARLAARLMVGAGFVGVCLLLQPWLSGASFGAVTVGLLSGMTGALAYLLLSKLGRSGEAQLTTTFWYSAALCGFAALPLAWNGLSVVTGEQLALVLCMGLLATFAQLAMIKAYSLASPLIPATCSYATVVFASVIGAWWWGERLDLLEMAGIALVVASGVSVFAQQARAPQKTGTETESEAEKRRQRETRANNLRSLYAVYKLGKHPEQVQYVFMMGDSQDNIAEEGRKRGEIADPYVSAALRTLWQERYMPARYDLDDLARLPKGSLGQVYAKHMHERSLRPDFYEDVAPHHGMHYLRLRVRQTHDIWHVLSGFDTDQFGEVGLQGFYFAQFTNGQSALILVSVILKSVLRGRFGELESHINAFCEGYCNGKRAEPLLAVKWEELWGEKVEELRRRYRIDTPRCRAGMLTLPAGA